MGLAKELVDRAWAAFEAQDAGMLGEVFHADAEMVMPGASLRGPEQIAQMCKGWWDALPDLRHETMDSFEAEGCIACEIRVIGTHTGPMVGPSGVVPATGRKLDWRSCDYVRIEGGKIRSWHAYFDQVELFTQLGLMAAPAEEKARA